MFELIVEAMPGSIRVEGRGGAILVRSKGHGEKWNSIMGLFATWDEKVNTL